MLHTSQIAIAPPVTDLLPHEIGSRPMLEVIAVARYHALQSVLYPDHAIRWTGKPVETRKAATPRSKPKAATAKRMSAEQFFDAFQTARRNVAAALGERWVVLGHATWATLPTGLRSFKGPRGGKVTLPKDIRVPPAEYWPGGVRPAELIIAEPSPRGLTPWVVGYGADGKHVMMHPTLAALQKTRAEQIEADAAWMKPKKMRERIASVRLMRRGALHAIEYLASHPETGSLYGRTIASATAELVKARVDLMAELRRFRDTWSFEA